MTPTQVIGHDSIAERLAFAFQQDRIPSGYLFIGFNGIGKSTLVRSFAQMMNCETHDHCHRCNNCSMFDHGSHPDFHVVKPDGRNIRIRQIHELIGYLDLKPAYAKKRVVLVKEAEKMNLESANAFLKILEEPPLNTLIVLSTADENQLLETINSRCQKIYFSPLRPDEVRLVLEENYNLDAETMDFVICYAQGRIRKRFVERVSQLSTMRMQVLQMLKNLTTEKMPDYCLLLENWVKQDLHDYFLEFCAAWLRDFITIHSRLPLPMINNDIKEELAEIPPRVSDESLQSCFDLVVETEAAIQSNASRNLALESLVIQMKQVFWGTLVV